MDANFREFPEGWELTNSHRHIRLKHQPCEVGQGLNETVSSPDCCGGELDNYGGWGIVLAVNEYEQIVGSSD